MLKFTLVLLTSLMLTSCISYRHDSSDAHDQTAALERGVTTSQWVYERLGKPLSRHQMADSTEILHYLFSEAEETKVHLLFIINIQNKESEFSDLFIAIRNDVVVDYWQD